MLRLLWASFATHSHSVWKVVPADTNHQWHIHTFDVGGHVYREFAAEGAGGQLVMVIPALDLVIGISGGDYRSGNWYTWMLESIPKYFIAAATAQLV